MSAAAARLEVEGLFKRFGGLAAVKDVGFSIAAGEILGLIGPNGSGKSTVMKSILGVERPDAGSVRIEGIEVAGWPPHRIARLGVGMVFQHSRPLHRQTVLENIVFGLLPDRLTGLLPSPAVDGRAREIAERVGLSAVLDRRPATLPFADLRKMEIAKAIARNPKVVLIDEPFAGLTARETASFATLIAEMRNDRRAVLIVDHNVKGISALVDRVLAMHAGERIAEGRAQDVMENETVRKVYLGGALETAARSETAFHDVAASFLDIRNLSVVYDRAQALENVSLHVRQGEFVAIVGLNGAGKTTLFNAVSGLVPYSGDIQRQGQSLRARSAATIAREGIVQSPEGRELFGAMTVRENLDMGGHGLKQNVTFALPHADRVYVLERGRIVWEGGPAQFATQAGAQYL
jgi:branched-chain amino acid transport system ATP-binding protein